MKSGGFLGLVRDVTERRAADANRLELERKLQETQRLESVGLLAGGIAHDFNNLLTVIMSVVELMLHGRPGDDPDRADLEDVRDAATRAAALTRQLLAFSRKQVMQLRAVDLNEVVRGMEGLLKPLLGEPVALKFSLTPALPPVKADPTLVTQVVMNLCVNARDAMPRGGRLTVSSALRSSDFPSRPVELPADDYVCLRVDDEGEGMSPEVQARVFEPFFTTREVGAGQGQSLAVARAVMERHHGSISFTSEPEACLNFEPHSKKRIGYLQTLCIGLRTAHFSACGAVEALAGHPQQPATVLQR